MISCARCCFSFFFFNDTATTEIYTLSLHDALPICLKVAEDRLPHRVVGWERVEVTGVEAVRVSGLGEELPRRGDRKSTRLNSSHVRISYAVFCLKKKNETPRCRLLIIQSGLL